MALGKPLADAETIFRGHRTSASTRQRIARLIRSSDFWNEEVYELRFGADPNRSSHRRACSIHRDWLLIELRTDWTATN